MEGAVEMEEEGVSMDKQKNEKVEKDVVWREVKGREATAEAGK